MALNIDEFNKESEEIRKKVYDLIDKNPIPKSWSNDKRLNTFYKIDNQMDVASEIYEKCQKNQDFTEALEQLKKLLDITKEIVEEIKKTSD